MNYYLFLLLAIFLNSFAHFFLKKGAIIQAIVLEKVVFMSSGLLCFGVSVIFYAIALTKLKLTVAFPLSLGIGAIITSVLAAYFLSEKLGLFFFVGLVLIAFGTYCITVLNV